MTSHYAPDLAPDLEPRLVQWQPAHRAHGGSTGELLTWTGVAAAVAVGAVAVGVLALGALAVGRLGADRARFRVLDIDELNGGRLRRRPF